MFDPLIKIYCTQTTPNGVAEYINSIGALKWGIVIIRLLIMGQLQTGPPNYQKFSMFAPIQIPIKCHRIRHHMHRTCSTPTCLAQNNLRK